MSNLNQPLGHRAEGAGPAANPLAADARVLYLSASKQLGACRAEARALLEQALGAARTLPCGLPSQPSALDPWSAQHTAQVGQAFRSYLQERQAGAGRRFFPTEAAALHFLRGAAPTKLVDGAWLYGAMDHWGDPAWHGLIRTYLEELGDGVEEMNHVAMYRALLLRHGCDLWHDLPDEHFVQGAIQLALALHGAELLPELVGYNLGYEQLPLHLLITARELDELGIDPYYFTLHVTVDNDASGHARRAVDAVHQLMARADDPAEFWRRVADGYRLNDLGACTTSIIGGFDLETELMRIMAAKAVSGQHMHSHACRIGGRSLTDWLSDPDGTPGLMAALQQAGWIERGKDAADSRFWHLVTGARAQMFGVFTGYELQVLRDWIEVGAPEKRVPSFRAQQRMLEKDAPHRKAPATPRGIIRRHGADAGEAAADALRSFEQRLAAAGGKPEMMAMLIPELSPDRHHSSVGLMATRVASRLLGT